MSKKEQHIKVPQLRFPEFLNGGEWIEKKLGDCLLSHPEYGINAAAVPYSENLPTYLRITDISEDGRYLSEQKVSVAKEVTDEDYLEQGDIVFARTGASVGKSYKYREEDGRLVFAGFLIRVRPDKSKLLSELLYQFLSSDSYWKWVAFTSQRSGQPGINGNEFASLLIPVPESKAEQQKIADCLSSLDDLIAAEREKLDALKAHKKGLMQELFPAEGNTVPRLRFPEFRGSGEWEEKVLGDVAEFLKGKGISKSEIAENGIQPCVRYGELYTHYSEIIDAVRSFTNLPKEELFLSEANDVIVPSSGETREDIATASCVLKDGIALGGDLNVIRSNVNGSFLSYYLGHCKKGAIAKLAQGDAVVHLYSSQLKKLQISFPKSSQEQQKIADCVSSVEELIKAQLEKINELKLHKKGLMQQLFPSELSEL